ncbi:MAG TPA: glutaredoxin family protein [Candidatus Dormibacteraeota bacterium]|nr:glutaredoxin family protein [Candidatus Dormibacteraeota bacterium]
MTRQGCHLCEQALALLRDLGHEPELVDVEDDDALHDLYDWRVPVVLLDGRVIAEGKVERTALVRALDRGGGGQAPS